jgi:hypothetical protein
MAQGPFQRAIQRIGNALGVLAPAQRAVRFAFPFTVRDVPETQAGSTLRGDSGSGEISGYTEIGLDTSMLPGIVTSRIIAGTSPLRVNGGSSADLGATNITLSIEPATTLSPGSLSAADKTLLATLAVGSVAPTPSTLLLRGPSGEGKCTSFESSSGGQFRANIGGAFVNVGSVDGSKNVQIGDTLEAASLTLLAKANGNIAAAVDGTGTAGLAAIGATATISLESNSFENLHAENGVLSAGSDGLFTCESTIGNYAFTASGATILSFTKAPIDPAPLSTAVIASDGDISLNGIHALTLNGGVGGTQSRVEASDSGHVLFQVNAAEVAQFNAIGLVFHKDDTWSITQPQSTSGAGRNLTIQAQQGIGGGTPLDGGDLILAAGDAGSDGVALQGDVIIELGKSGDDGGFFRLQAGAFGEFMSIQYGATLAATAIAHAYPYEETVNGYLSIRSLTDDVTIGCGAAKVIIFKVDATEVARFDAGGPPAPQSVGAANSVGTSTEVAKADHVHDHGTQALGTGIQHAVATTSFAGFLSAADKTKIDALSWNKECGANTITNTTTTRYLTPGYNSGTASINALDMPVTKAFKADSLRMTTRVAVATGVTITATLRKNGSPVGTAILATDSAATSGSSSFTAVSYAAGDTWGLQVDKSGATGGSGPTDIFYTIGITPP